MTQSPQWRALFLLCVHTVSMGGAAGLLQLSQSHKSSSSGARTRSDPATRLRCAAPFYRNGPRSALFLEGDFLLDVNNRRENAESLYRAAGRGVAGFQADLSPRLRIEGGNRFFYTRDYSERPLQVFDAVRNDPLLRVSKVNEFFVRARARPSPDWALDARASAAAHFPSADVPARTWRTEGRLEAERSFGPGLEGLAGIIRRDGARSGAPAASLWIAYAGLRRPWGPAGTLSVHGGQAFAASGGERRERPYAAAVYERRLSPLGSVYIYAAQDMAIAAGPLALESYKDAGARWSGPLPGRWRGSATVEGGKTVLQGRRRTAWRRLRWEGEARHGLRSSIDGILRASVERASGGGRLRTWDAGLGVEYRL